MGAGRRIVGGGIAGAHLRRISGCTGGSMRQMQFALNYVFQVAGISDYLKSQRMPFSNSWFCVGLVNTLSPCPMFM